MGSIGVSIFQSDKGSKTMTTLRKEELKGEQFATLMELIAKGLAAEIGGNWSVDIKEDYHYPNCHLVCNGKQRLFVRNSWPYGKLKISVSLDKTELPTSGRSYAFDQLWKESTTAINCSYSKSARAIAADIKRRLWPSVGKLVAKAIEDGENECKRVAYQDEQMARLIKAIGNAGEYRDKKNNGTSPYIRLNLPEGYGDIKATFYSEGNASISIELRSLDIESAIRICEALQAIEMGK